MFKKSKTIDEVLSSFTELKADLLDILVKKQAQVTYNEQQVIVLNTQNEILQDDMVRASRVISKIDELIS